MKRPHVSFPLGDKKSTLLVSYNIKRTHSLHIWNFGAEVSMRLAYPSSKRVKDWDKLEAEVESNGTVFSTDEKEVGTKKIESTPLDGMELKKWEI
ncbi:unnamed protein product [Brassica oleracea]